MLERRLWHADEISLREGVIAFGLKREGDWWYGESLGLVGWFPATYVEPMEVCTMRHCTLEYPA
jgi:hypothetical protein